MSEITKACAACGHAESDHSTQRQIEWGYPPGCTAVVVDSPDPRFLELCGCTFGPAPLLTGDAVELPGFSDVPVADTRRSPWTT